jgi:hypothetical protein
MSKAVIASVVARFVDSHVPQVLAVTGPWGVGKTFALRRQIESYNGQGSLKRYAYTSVFGAQSISEVRTSLLAKTRTFPLREHSGNGARAKFESEAHTKKLREVVDHLKEMLPFGGKHLVVALEAIAGSFVVDTLVVLDDIERLGEQLKLADLMGLVSELKEQARCKVILIHNEDEFSPENGAAYARYAEKVVDQKLQFVMSSDEAVELGLAADTPLREFVTEPIHHLDINNIRVIQKIEAALRMVYPLIKGSSEKVKQQAAISIPVFASSLYERGRGFPEPEQILKYNSYTHRMLARENEPAIGDQEWVSRLQLCGFTNADEFDGAILDAMQCGYVEGAEISSHAAALDALADRDRLNEIFTAVWRKFRDRLDMTASQLVDEFVEAVEQAATVITPVTINSTVKLVRELGFEGKADEIIEIYIDQRRNTPKLFDIDHESRLGEVDDPNARARFLEIFNDSGDALSLTEAADLIVQNERWDDGIVPAFIHAQPDELIALLKSKQGDDLQRLATGMLQLQMPVEDSESYRAKVILALQTIGRESSLNRIRVRRWGVVVDD